jgi:hypothetical protein
MSDDKHREADLVRRLNESQSEVFDLKHQLAQPIPMLLHCPMCNARHIDEGEFATKPHHTHACQSCGMCWRPAIVATCGVQFLPGFKNGETKP